MGASSVISLSYAVDGSDRRWRLEDEDVPETPLHDAIIELLMLVLKHCCAAEGRPALICSNLGCRWDPADARIGTDPDVVLVEPPPPEGEQLSTLRVWEPGHASPRVAVEVVSEHNPDKDYLEAPLRCARLGVKELWVFDPGHFGPQSTGGPYRLQVWRLGPSSASQPMMTRAYAGDGPAFSVELGAWLVPNEAPARLRLADDASGLALWPTAFEAERAEKERQRAETERERAEKERERAEKERERAERERERAERERERAEKERLAAKLRSLGVDPDEV